jgi:nitrate reductase (NAD(P)H)
LYLNKKRLKELIEVIHLITIFCSAGVDSTEEFDAIHSKKAWKLLDDYFIGQLRPDDASIVKVIENEEEKANVNALGQLVALDSKKKIPFTLSERIQLSPDSLLLRFKLQSPKHILVRNCISFHTYIKILQTLYKLVYITLHLIIISNFII